MPIPPQLKSRQLNLAKRNAKIYDRFKEWDLRVYNIDYVLDQLGEEFSLAPSTIYKIIKGHS